MRMSQDEKERSHARIVASASRLIRVKGIEGASVGEVMQGAGMTHGGFYKHFETKDDLIASAIEEAFAHFVTALDSDEPRAAFAAYRDLYLSGDHRTHPEIGCPVATLGQEVARAPQTLKAVFGAGVGRIVTAIARSMRGSAEARRRAAIREFSMMVGAIVIARASDETTASAVLDACKGKQVQ